MFLFLPTNLTFLALEDHDRSTAGQNSQVHYLNFDVRSYYVFPKFPWHHLLHRCRILWQRSDFGNNVRVLEGYRIDDGKDHFLFERILENSKKSSLISKIRVGMWPKNLPGFAKRKSSCFTTSSIGANNP